MDPTNQTQPRELPDADSGSARRWSRFRTRGIRFPVDLSAGLWFRSFWLFALTAGCGGQAASHCYLAACGGNVVGTWELADACVDETKSANIAAAILGPECAGQAETTESTLSATLQFLAGAAYRVEGTNQATGTFRLTGACLTSLAGDTFTASADSCVSLSTTLDQRMGKSSLQGTAVCALGDGGCDCNIAAAARISAAGVYAVNGTQITLDQQPPVGFCVSEGDQVLTLETPVGTWTALRAP